MTSPTTALETELDDGTEPPAGRPPVGWVRRSAPFIVIAVLALLGAVFAGGWVAADHLGSRGPGDTSIDAGFSRDMSTHHQQAVRMSMLLLADPGTSQDVRQIAYDIATTQQEQVGEMDAWLQSWGLSQTGSQPQMAWMDSGDMAGMAGMSGNDHLLPDGRMPGMATDAELASLAKQHGKAADVMFLQLMIRHHVGGLDMATFAAQKGHTGQVRELARKIVAAQTSDLTAMRQLLAADHAKELPVS